MSNKFMISDFYCTKCGRKGINIPRKVGKYREAGHLKRLYCIYCKSEQNHVEIRPFHSDYNYEDFLLEMQYHNFDEDGNRKETYRIFRGHLKQEGLVHG